MRISRKLKSAIQKFPKLYYTLSWIWHFVRIYWRLIPRFIKQLIVFKKLRYLPTVLQLPITYKCNFDCVMCGMKKDISKKDFTPEDLSKILDDKLFRRIRSVGVNGGEPFIKPDLSKYISVLTEKLPKLKYIYIITNGYFTENILHQLQIIKGICEKKGIKVILSISIDGAEQTHDLIRRKKGAFKNAITTYSLITKDMNKYCDKVNVICTITKLNIEYINEIDVWAKMNNVDIVYNIATVHKRLKNEDRFEDFSIFTNEKARCLAAEFFYSKFLETSSPRYYALYYYITKNLRLSPCTYQPKGIRKTPDGVTVTPSGQLSYCATYSKELGNAKNNSAYKMFITNLKYLKELKEKHCNTCSHYIETVNLRGYLTMCKELFKHYKLPLRYYW